MNNERKRKKAYYYIDVFFLCLPLLLFIGGFVIKLISIYSHQGSFNDVSSSDIIDFLGQYLFDFIQVFFDVIIDSLEGVNEGFGLVIANALNSFANFFVSGGSLALMYVVVYFTWVIMYEFISLMISIVLWIPRFIKNKIQKGVFE